MLITIVSPSILSVSSGQKQLGRMRRYSQCTSSSAFSIRRSILGVSINEELEMSMNITDTAVEATILVVDGDDNVVEERIGVRMMF